MSVTTIQQSVQDIETFECTPDPTFKATADEESQVIVVQVIVDVLGYIPATNGTYEITTKNLAPLLTAQYKMHEGYHVQEEHTVLVKVKLLSANTNYIAPIVVSASVPALNGSSMMNCVPEYDSRRLENDSNSKSISSPKISSRNNINLKQQTDDDYVIVMACFSMGCGFPVTPHTLWRHKDTPKTENVLKIFGDVSQKQMREDLLLSSSKGYMMVKHFSVLEHAIKVNVRKRALIPYDCPTGGWMFRKSHLLEIIKVVDQHKKENVTYLDLRQLAFTVRRRDGLPFDDRTGTMLETTNRTINDLGAKFPFHVLVKFEVKMFRNRPTIEDHLDEITEEEETEDIYQDPMAPPRAIYASKQQTQSIQYGVSSPQFTNSRRTSINARLVQ